MAFEDKATSCFERDSCQSAISANMDCGCFNPLRGFASEAVGIGWSERLRRSDSFAGESLQALPLRSNVGALQCAQFAEALFGKLKSLEISSLGKLGGRICAVVDLKTSYPVQTWFHERPYAHESNFVANLLELVTPKTLLLLDRGFWNYSLFEQLLQLQSDFITRLKTNAQYKSVSILSQSSSHRDTLIRLGTGDRGNPILDLRLVEIRHGNGWYRYLTSVLDPKVLPPYVVADLYSRRWRIEESFLLLQRLLGLSYLWTGSINGIKLQLWATWLLYAVLIDLSDEVADELTLPMNSISVEMVFRGIYHFTQAASQGTATNFIAYLTAPENRDLGIVKSTRPKRAKPPLNLSPSPS